MSTTRREFNAGLISAIAVSGISNSASAGDPHGIDLLREQKYANVIAPEYQFGTFGIGTVGLNNPSGVFVSDAVWIADTYNNSVKQFKYDGSLISVIYYPPEHKGALINPTDLVVHQDNIYVVDSGANSLVVFKKDGEFVTRIGNNGTLSSPHSVAAHEDVLAISDTGNDRVSVYDLSGKLLRVIGSFGAQPGKFNEPLGVAFDDFGRLYVVDSNNNRVQKFEKDGTNIGAWGDYGSSSGTFAQPVGVGVVDGKVYVADTLNHRMQAFELDGTYAFQFGRHPVNGHEGVGRTHYPYRIAGLKHSSILATVEPNENRVQIYDLNKVSELKSVDDDAWWGKGTKFHYGRRMIANASFVGISEPDTHAVLLFEQGKETDAPTFLTLLGGRGSRAGEFIQPSGLALKPDGSKLFVSDSGNRRLQTFTISEPTNLVQFGGPTGGPQSPPEVPQVTLAEVVSLDGDQLQSQIKRFSAPGQSSSFSPSGMRVGPDGRLYVIDPYNGRVAVLNESYEIIRTIGRNATIDETILRFPLDLTFGKNGLIYITDAYNARIVVFDVEGNHRFSIGGHVTSNPGPIGFVAPFGIAGGVDGKLYVTDEGQHKIFKISEEGELEKIWGGWGTGPNQYYKPKGIAQSPDSRFIYVVDFGNHRGQKLTADGEFVLEFGVSDAVAQEAVRP